MALVRLLARLAVAQDMAIREAAPCQDDPQSAADQE